MYKTGTAPGTGRRVKGNHPVAVSHLFNAFGKRAKRMEESLSVTLSCQTAEGDVWNPLQPQPFWTANYWETRRFWTPNQMGCEGFQGILTHNLESILEEGEKMRKVDRNQRVVWDGHKTWPNSTKIMRDRAKIWTLGGRKPILKGNKFLHNGKLTQLLSKNTTAQRKPIRRFLNSGYMTWIPLRSSHIISYHLANPTWSLQPRSAMLLWLLPLDRHQSTEKSLAPATFFDWVIFCWISVLGKLGTFGYRSATWLTLSLALRFRTAERD